MSTVRALVQHCVKTVGALQCPRALSGLIRPNSLQLSQENEWMPDGLIWWKMGTQKQRKSKSFIITIWPDFPFLLNLDPKFQNYKSLFFFSLSSIYKKCMLKHQRECFTTVSVCFLIYSRCCQDSHFAAWEACLNQFNSHNVEIHRSPSETVKLGWNCHARGSQHFFITHSALLFFWSMNILHNFNLIPELEKGAMLGSRQCCINPVQLQGCPLSNNFRFITD